MLSSRGVLSFFLSQVMLAVPKKKGAAFTPSVKDVFCVFFGGEGIETGVFVDLVDLFDIRIIFHFVGLSRSHL